MIGANIEELKNSDLDIENKVGVLLHCGEWRIHSFAHTMGRSFVEELAELGFKIVEDDSSS